MKSIAEKVGLGNKKEGLGNRLFWKWERIGGLKDKCFGVLSGILREAI
jgi:hypothetical protein